MAISLRDLVKKPLKDGAPKPLDITGRWPSGKRGKDWVKMHTVQHHRDPAGNDDAPFQATNVKVAPRPGDSVGPDHTFPTADNSDATGPRDQYQSAVSNASGGDKGLGEAKKLQLNYHLQKKEMLKVQRDAKKTSGKYPSGLPKSVDDKKGGTTYGKVKEDEQIEEGIGGFRQAARRMAQQVVRSDKVGKGSSGNVKMKQQVVRLDKVGKGSSGNVKMKQEVVRSSKIGEELDEKKKAKGFRDFLGKGKGPIELDNDGSTTIAGPLEDTNLDEASFKLNPKKKGMFKGKSLSSIKKSETHDSGTKKKEDVFAINAKEGKFKKHSEEASPPIENISTDEVQPPKGLRMIAELSKKTQGNYLKKAAADVDEWGSGYDEYSRERTSKRLKGIKAVGKKLAKEETLDELSKKTIGSYNKRNEETINEDMMGKKCIKCKKGNYKETSQMDDMDGVLHCSKCNHETIRHPKKVK